MMTTRPPLESVYEELHTRLTVGQMPSASNARPAIASAAPAASRPLNFSPALRADFSHSPAHNPSIIVASVGMQLSVDQPPLLATNGRSRGKRFRNQTSNAHDR